MVKTLEVSGANSKQALEHLKKTHPILFHHSSESGLLLGWNIRDGDLCKLPFAWSIGRISDASLKVDVKTHTCTLKHCPLLKALQENSLTNFKNSITIY